MEGDVEGRLEFGFLGELSASHVGRALDLGPRLQRCLLAVLVVDAGHVVPVDRLVDLLWGDEPPAAATASLQAYVSQLRRILEPDRPARAPARVLVTQDPGYVLRVDPDQVDGLRFQTLVTAGHAALVAGRPADAALDLDAALGLWRGEPLFEFAGEPWALAVASRYTEIHDLALEDRIEAWLALGRHVAAVAELEAMVQARPLRERRWAQLVVANYRSGRQADALRAYQRCRSILADELGIEPGPELKRLERDVLAQEPSLDWTAPEASPGTTHLPDDTAAPAARPGFLVARLAQRERLRDRFESAGQGRGGVVLLVGEPGIGKTTLAETAAEMAREAGANVAWSRCLEAASAPAFWPWTQLLRDLPGGDANAAARRRLEGESALAEDPGAALFRTYEVVLRALVEASQHAPILAVVDDLHAADEASLTLLELVAGDLGRLRVLFVVTLRDTEPSLALDRTVGELLRVRGVERLAVPALDPGEVAQLTESLTGQEARPPVVAALFERTGGNAFYLTELLRLLGSTHRSGALTIDDVVAHDVPAGLRDVLTRRLSRLPDGTQALLTVAAVSGRDLDLDVLERAAQLDSEQLMLGLEPAAAAGLLTDVDGGWGYRFRHPLIHEAIYAGVSRVERAQLHARVASALEAMHVADTTNGRAQLAHHYLAAGPLGDPLKAISYGRDAARDAMRQGAWSDAIRHLEQALSAVSAAVADADRLRSDVLVELGRARRAKGLIHEAHAALEEAIQIADRIGDQDRVLTAAVAYGAVALWGSREWGETDDELVTILKRQLERIGDRDPERRVRILSTLASELYFDDAAPAGWAYANEGLELARRLGQPEEMGIAACGYLMSALVNDHLRERRVLIEELLADPGLGLSADVDAILRANLLTERLRSGDLALFDTELNSVRDLATDVLHSTELQAQLCFIEACRNMLVGDAARAREAGELGFQLMGSVSATWAQPSRFVMETSLMLISEELAEHAEELALRTVNPDHPSVRHLAAAAAALAYVKRGEDARALELVDRWFRPPPRAWTWIQPMAHWAQVAAELGAPDPAWLYDHLLPHAGELAIVGVGADCGGAVDSILAGLALQLGRTDDACAHAHAGLTLELHAGARIWIPRSNELLATARARSSRNA